MRCPNFALIFTKKQRPSLGAKSNKTRFKITALCTVPDFSGDLARICGHRQSKIVQDNLAHKHQLELEAWFEKINTVISSRRRRAEYLRTTESSIRQGYLIKKSVTEKKCLADREQHRAEQASQYNHRHSTKRHDLRGSETKTHVRRQQGVKSIFHRAPQYRMRVYG